MNDTARHSNTVSKTAVVLMLLVIALITVGSMDKWRTAASVQIEPRKAYLSNEVQINAAKRGNPWINVEDGRAAVAESAGPDELRSDFDTGNSRPLSMATADFDEDGTSDLVT